MEIMDQGKRRNQIADSERMLYAAYAIVAIITIAVLIVSIWY